jgi:hypothetical protein
MLTKEQEAANAAEEAKQRALAARREVDAASYERLVDTENVNRCELRGGGGGGGGGSCCLPAACAAASTRASQH